MAFGGYNIGLLRDGTHMLPIVARLPEEERFDFESLNNVKIWSPSLQTYIPVEQVIDGVELQWSEPLIQRRDRKRTLTVLADHDVLGDETPASLFARVKPKIEALIHQKATASVGAANTKALKMHKNLYLVHCQWVTC